MKYQSNLLIKPDIYSTKPLHLAIGYGFSTRIRTKSLHLAYAIRHTKALHLRFFAT